MLVITLLIQHKLCKCCHWQNMAKAVSKPVFIIGFV